MNRLTNTLAKIDDLFWNPRLKTNFVKSIFHQWKMLEASGCIDNFRIAAGEKAGFRRGWFFADSDATKWLDAAARLERNHHDPELCRLMDDFIALLGRAQERDGYLFTYNQIHFPGMRWVNLQIEHELYCHGHLIEAGVSHYQTTGREEMLVIARKAADLLVKDFLHAGPMATPGHEEVEIALLRLYEVTRHEPYRVLAVHFIEQRGRSHFFGFSLARQFASNARREKWVKSQRQEYFRTHPEAVPSDLPAMNESRRPPLSLVRFFLSGLSGKYFQQHRLIREQNIPVGHAVRFAYLETAAAMTLRWKEDAKLLEAMETAWQHMVTRRMDVTGGLGALPDIEGFGRDYELDPEVAYNETCAAIASLYWSWQLACLTGKAQYSDLCERLLFNAIPVGVNIQGEGYFYNNPTLSRRGFSRQAAFSICCCPSNLSRTFADLGKYIFSADTENIWIHQYIGCTAQPAGFEGLMLEIASGLPCTGEATLKVHSERPEHFILWLRKPSWAGDFSIEINGERVAVLTQPGDGFEPTATGYDPRQAQFIPIDRVWREGDTVSIHTDMEIKTLHPHRKVKVLKGKVAFSRGPLVYCLESEDNQAIDLFDCKVDVQSLYYDYCIELLGGTGVLLGKSEAGESLRFIPYFLWGNRGSSAMTVWVNEGKQTGGGSCGL